MAAIAKVSFTEVRISTVDPRYAYVHLEGTPKCPGCAPPPPGENMAQGAVSIVQRSATGWHVTSLGSVPPWCGELPKAVRVEFFHTDNCPAKP